MDDLETAMSELRKAFVNTKHEHAPEWSLLKFQGQKRRCAETIVREFTEPTDYGAIFDSTFSRAYYRHKVAELITRLINACVQTYSPELHPRNERYLAEIAALANNDWGNGARGFSSDYSTASGLRNMYDGANKWLDEMNHHSIDLAVPEDIQNILFKELLTDIARDKKAATYERLYVCVRSMAMNPWKSVVAIGYIRAMIHLLIWEDLEYEQAMFLVRGLKLLGMIEHDDTDKKKLKQDIKSAKFSLSRHLNTPGSELAKELFSIRTIDQVTERYNAMIAELQ